MLPLHHAPAGGDAWTRTRTRNLGGSGAIHYRTPPAGPRGRTRTHILSIRSRAPDPVRLLAGGQGGPESNRPCEGQSLVPSRMATSLQPVRSWSLDLESNQDLVHTREVGCRYTIEAPFQSGPVIGAAVEPSLRRGKRRLAPNGGGRGSGTKWWWIGVWHHLS